MMVVCFRIVKMLRPNIKLLDFLVKPQILASQGGGADCWSVRMTFYLDSYALHHCTTALQQSVDAMQCAAHVCVAECRCNAVCVALSKVGSRLRLIATRGYEQPSLCGKLDR